jgi:succinate dehydrogenase/fumarate reductase flavoprotein subunit
MGGVRIDEWGRSSLPWLYAAGEISAGIHGGNRLDSNEISAGQVFGLRAGQNAAESIGERPAPQNDEAVIAHWRDRLATLGGESLSPVVVKAMKDEIRQANWRGAGIIRNGRTIAEGIATSSALSARLAESRPANLSDLPEFFEAENMAQTGRLIMQAASLRTESRAAHYREDFPERDDNQWLVNIDVSRGEADDAPAMVRRAVAVAEAG